MRNNNLTINRVKYDTQNIIKELKKSNDNLSRGLIGLSNLFNPLLKRSNFDMKTIERNKAQLLNFYYDDGHGWLEVPRSLIPFHVLKQISCFSYQDRVKEMVYLEEDCDASKFINVYGRDRMAFNEVCHNGSSKIRQLPQFSL